jgi:hypothetical protein
MSDTTDDDDIEPLTPEERRRRVVVLCCHFMRNLALHRAGLQAEVRQYLLNPNHPQGEFRVQAHGNFLDARVLEWWKLFADYNGQHQWHRVVDDRACFGRDLYATRVSRVEFTRTIAEVERKRRAQTSRRLQRQQLFERRWSIA